jgi:hypothetical protein
MKIANLKIEDVIGEGVIAKRVFRLVGILLFDKTNFPGGRACYPPAGKQEVTVIRTGF